MQPLSEAHRSGAKQALPDFRAPAFLRSHIRQTLAFYARHSFDPSGGFHHYYKDDGTVYDAHTRHLVSSARFVFNFATAYRRFGNPEDLQSTRHALEFLNRAHAQPQGGYAWEIDWRDGRATVRDGTQHCYGLAFVLLANAHALMAGVDEAREGLAATWALMEQRFWQPAHGLYADEATPDWQLLPYRGQNANMHACEAMLAAFDATGETHYLQRATAIAESVTQRLAKLSGGLIWEHYHADWSVDWEYNKNNHSNIFRPWGFQTGHLTEWAKLLLQLEARLPERDRSPALADQARHLFDSAVNIGWDHQHGGLIYGFDQNAQVYDANKYFWVQAESISAAAHLAVRFGDQRYWDWYDKIWDYAWTYFVDHEYGAWFRVLAPDNSQLSDEKSPAGKTDYHTMGACHDTLQVLALSQSKVRHVVLMDFSDRTEDGVINRHVQDFIGLRKQISAIGMAEVGKNISREGLGTNFTHMALLSFLDQEDCATYLEHPTHQAFAGRLRNDLRAIVVADIDGA